MGLTVLHVALFRNMNLGQGWAPRTGAALEEPFRAAGARSVRSFQTNGTVAFDPAERPASEVVAEVCADLARTTSYTDLSVVHPALVLADLVRDQASVASTDDMVAFFTGDETAALAGVELLGSGPGWVVTRFDESPRNPGRAVLAAIGPRATTRTFGTVARLCRALGLVDLAVRTVERPAAVVPDDLAAALSRAGVRARFDSLSASQQRMLVAWVEGAVREQTRERRVAGLVDRVRG